MVLRRGLILSLALISLSACSARPATPELELTPGELDWVATQIFQNECAGRHSCLVHWNPGESFPSLGIGHFIWYPPGVDEPFVESFPDLIRFMEERDAPVPAWLAGLEPMDAPWPDRGSFLARQQSDRLEGLRDFLWQSRGLQAEFAFLRARASLGRVVAAAPESQREDIRNRLQALSQTPGGVYALVDYVNFKGEGLSGREAYQGQGWGLLQVLQEMDAATNPDTLAAFRDAAARVLTRRAHNAPRAIEREQWLPGWLRRLQTYQEPPAGSRRPPSEPRGPAEP